MQLSASSFASLLAGLCIAYSTGANDAANAMGTAVGTGVRTVRQAAALVAVFGVLGVTLQGQAVATTVGLGMMSLDEVAPSEAQTIVLAAYISAGLWVTLTTYLGLPASTSHSLAGAMAGAGLASRLVPLCWPKLALVGAAWVVTPIAAGTLAYVLGRATRVLRGREHRLARLWAWLLTASGIYMAYSWGASGVASVAGPLLGGTTIGEPAALGAGGLAAAAGVLLWGASWRQWAGA